MRQNELMVGDWVKLDFYDTPYGDGEDAVWKNGKITAIHHGNWVDVNFGGPLDECDIEVEDIQPIPLTPEILEKNFEFLYRSVPGGIYAAAQAVDTYRAKGVTINYVHQYQYAEILNIRYVVFRYVHQLQHALRLYGIEKEIEL